MMNHIKTTLLLSLLTVLMVLMGSAVGGKAGMIFAFFMAIAMNFFSYWFSDKIVLKMYGAHEKSTVKTILPSTAWWRTWLAVPVSPCPKSTSSLPPIRMLLLPAATRHTPLLQPQKVCCEFSRPKSWQAAWPMSWLT